MKPKSLLREIHKLMLDFLKNEFGLIVNNGLEALSFGVREKEALV